MPNTLPSGVAKDLVTHCANYTSNSGADSFQGGAKDATTSDWTDAPTTIGDCMTAPTLRLYCFEQ